MGKTDHENKDTDNELTKQDTNARQLYPSTTWEQYAKWEKRE